MSDADSYKILIDHYREWMFGLPDSEYLLPMLKARFSPEDAQFLSQLPFIGHNVEKLSKKLNIPSEELREKLDLVMHESRKDLIREILGDTQNSVPNKKISSEKILNRQLCNMEGRWIVYDRKRIIG